MVLIFGWTNLYFPFLPTKMGLQLSFGAMSRAWWFPKWPTRISVATWVMSHDFILLKGNLYIHVCMYICIYVFISILYVIYSTGRHAYQFHFWVLYIIFQSSYTWTLNYQHISCLKPPISWSRGIPFLLARQCRGLGNANCLVGLRLLNLQRFNIMDFLKRCPSDKWTFMRLWNEGWNGEALGFTSSAQKKIEQTDFQSWGAMSLPVTTTLCGQRPEVDGDYILPSCKGTKNRPWNKDPLWRTNQYNGLSAFWTRMTWVFQPMEIPKLNRYFKGMKPKIALSQIGIPGTSGPPREKGKARVQNPRGIAMAGTEKGMDGGDKFKILTYPLENVSWKIVLLLKWMLIVRVVISVNRRWSFVLFGNSHWQCQQFWGWWWLAQDAFIEMFQTSACTRIFQRNLLDHVCFGNFHHLRIWKSIHKSSANKSTTAAIAKKIALSNGQKIQPTQIPTLRIPWGFFGDRPIWSSEAKGRAAVKAVPWPRNVNASTLALHQQKISIRFHRLVFPSRFVV